MGCLQRKFLATIMPPNAKHGSNHDLKEINA
jgi:hypothetical protein